MRRGPPRLSLNSKCGFLLCVLSTLLVSLVLQYILSLSLGMDVALLQFLVVAASFISYHAIVLTVVMPFWLFASKDHRELLARMHSIVVIVSVAIFFLYLEVHLAYTLFTLFLSRGST